MKKLIKYIIVVSFVGLLGCDGTTLREKFTFSRSGPDEYSVLSYKSLAIPPNFELLDPDNINAEADSSTPGNIIMSPNNGVKDYKSTQIIPNTGEALLLEQAGQKVTKENNIRSLLEQDKTVDAKPKKASILDLFSRKNKPCAKDVVDDPEADKNTRDYKSKSVQVLRKDGLEEVKKPVCDIKNGIATNCDGTTIRKEFSIPLKPKGNNSVK